MREELNETDSFFFVISFAWCVFTTPITFFTEKGLSVRTQTALGNFATVCFIYISDHPRVCVSGACNGITISRVQQYMLIMPI